MSSVTVTGVSSVPVVLTYASAQNAILAQQLAGEASRLVAAGDLTPVEYTGVPLSAPTPGQPEMVIVQAGGPLVLPVEATTLINVASTPAVIFGGGGDNQTVLSGDPSSLTYFTNGGSGNIVTGDGKNLIVESGSGWNITTGSGKDSIVLSSGNNSVSAGGGKNAIEVTGGSNLITSTGQDRIEVLSGSVTVSAAGNSNSTTLTNVSGNALFIGGSAPATVTGGSGSVTVFASAGGLFQGGTGGHNLLIGGEGVATLAGGGDGDLLIATGAQTTHLTAASGAETLLGSLSVANNLYQAGGGADLISAGSGADTISGGPGASTVLGGGGANVFQFVDGNAGGEMTILDFGHGDKVHLTGYSPVEVDTALASATVTGTATTIHLTDNTAITFANLTNLSKSDFS